MFIFASIAFRFASFGIDDFQILSHLRRNFSESFRVESIERGTLAAYERNFSQSLSNDPSAVKRFQKPPLPFAFKLPSSFQPGDNPGSRLDLIIVGSAVNDIDCYIGAVRRVFSAVRLPSGLDVSIIDVATIAADGTMRSIVDDSPGLSLINADDLSPPVWSVSGVDLDFISPLRLVREGVALRRITFGDYIRPLMRRVSSLAYYYCGIEYDLDFRRLASDSIRVSTDDSLFEWTRCEDFSCGVLGKVMFTGDLQEYIRFILLGERLNLGKGAAYGMGGYNISAIHTPANR